MNIAHAKTVPGNRNRMRNRLPMPIFRTTRGINPIAPPPALPTTTPDGVTHTSPAIALAWMETRRVMAARAA